MKVTATDGVLSEPCPECGAKLILKKSKHGSFYGCEKYRETKCTGTVSCHPGTEVPLGFPAKKHTKQLRMRAHQALDSLWEDGKMTRGEAYAWMKREMRLPFNKAHIGMFDDAECERLVRLVDGV